MRYIVDANTPADNIVEFIAAHEEALKQLKQLLPTACAKEGHVWSEPKRITIPCYRSVYEQGQCDFDGSEMSRGKYVDEWDHDAYYWDRKCSRCGTVERREEVVVVNRSNPFEESKR